MSGEICPLLWGSFQINLECGLVKTCCRTAAESMNDNEDFAAFLNMPKARTARAPMLASQLPAVCRSCVEEEAMGVESYREWFGMTGTLGRSARPLAEADQVDNGFPGHLELIFSSNCNLKCLYCEPEFSSRWRGRAVAKDAAVRRRIDHFWQWYEANASRRTSIQINGGEPLIDPDFGTYLTRLAEPVAEQPGFRIGLVSNLAMPTVRLARWLPVLDQVSQRAQLTIGVSVDGVGALAEQLRPGLSWRLFDANLRCLASAVPQATIQLTPTVNKLNLTRLGELVTYVRSVSATTERGIGIRAGIVFEPEHLSPLRHPSVSAADVESEAQFVAESGKDIDGVDRLARQMVQIAAALRETKVLA